MILIALLENDEQRKEMTKRAIEKDKRREPMTMATELKGGI